jgi:hypothetical protein
MVFRCCLSVFVLFCFIFNAANANSAFKEESARDHLTWNRQFATGTYDVKMVVVFENGETETLIATFKVEVL